MDFAAAAKDIISIISQPDFYLPKLVGLLILALGWPLANLIKKRLILVIEKHCEDRTIPRFVASLVHSLLILFILIIALAKLGIPTSALLASLAGLSLALGLSLKSSISNLAAGIFIVLFRPFKENDTITICGNTGTVKRIEIMFTYLIGEEDHLIIIPNNKLLQNPIESIPSQPH